MGSFLSKTSTERKSSSSIASTVQHVELTQRTSTTTLSTPAVAPDESAAPRLVIAIDFGSYASGYAYQCRSEFEENPLDIYINTSWQNGGPCAYKTRTALLLKPDHSLGEFGFAAEQKFSTIQTGETDGDNWFFFHGFKMTLYHIRDKLDSKTTVEDAKGRHLPATLVFGRSIQYMKDHAINLLQENGVAYIEEDTKWVITVPAIWTDRAKALMREAATEVAGIRINNLTIALEPECAAIYCSHLTRNQLEIKSDEEQLRYIADPGSVIMVLDIGGGTVDITTVRVREGETMEYVHKSGGGPCGGMNVDDWFFTMLKDILGEDVLAEFIRKNATEYFDINTDFEIAKRGVLGSSDGKGKGKGKGFILRFPAPLKELWERKRGQSINNLLEKAHIQGIKFATSRLTFPLEVIWDLYDKCAEDILTSINSILTHPDLKGLPISAVLAVGGFAMSGYMIDVLRKELKKKGIPVVRPKDAEIAVVKGAVLFGQKEDIIYSRIMPYTYGVDCVMEFNERHSIAHKFEDGRKVLAKYCFRKHVTIGQAVKLGEWFDEKEYYPDDDAQKSVTIYVFASDKTDPTHTTDEGCLFVGQFDIEFPNTANAGSSQRAVKIALQFGGTEMLVKVTCHDGTTYKKLLLCKI